MIIDMFGTSTPRRGGSASPRHRRLGIVQIVFGGPPPVAGQARAAGTRSGVRPKPLAICPSPNTMDQLNPKDHKLRIGSANREKVPSAAMPTEATVAEKAARAGQAGSEGVSATGNGAFSVEAGLRLPAASAMRRIIDDAVLSDTFRMRCR